MIIFLPKWLCKKCSWWWRLWKPLYLTKKMFLFANLYNFARFAISPNTTYKLGYRFNMAQNGLFLFLRNNDMNQVLYNFNNSRYSPLTRKQFPRIRFSYEQYGISVFLFPFHYIRILFVIKLDCLGSLPRI